jgi:hypothetical protein
MNMQQIGNIVMDTVREAENGGIACPNGYVYAALMNQMQLHQYEALLDMLCSVGLLDKQGDLLFLTPKARDIYRRNGVDVAAL